MLTFTLKKLQRSVLGASSVPDISSLRSSFPHLLVLNYYCLLKKITLIEMHRWFYTTSQSALVQIYAEQPILHIAALSSLIQGVPFKVELRSLAKINQLHSRVTFDVSWFFLACSSLALGASTDTLLCNTVDIIAPYRHPSPVNWKYSFSLQKSNRDEVVRFFIV